MPYYTYKCTNADCGNETDRKASMSEFDKIHPECPDCGASSDYTFVPTVPQVAFKDGPSGGWPSKGNRFRDYRMKASADAARRQKERYGDAPTLVPNYKGQETESWKEAQIEAIKNDGPEKAASYNTQVATEAKNAEPEIKVYGSGD